MKKPYSNSFNSRRGNKKITLLLVLKALEQMSDEKNPIKQVHLAKMVNDIGGSLGLDLWCDRKTVGRHLELLKAAGYNVVKVRGKGCYLNSGKFTKSESETMISLIQSSALPDNQKMDVISKLILQQANISIEAFEKFLKSNVL